LAVARRIFVAEMIVVGWLAAQNYTQTRRSLKKLIAKMPSDSLTTEACGACFAFDEVASDFFHNGCVANRTTSRIFHQPRIICCGSFYKNV